MFRMEADLQLFQITANTHRSQIGHLFAAAVPTQRDPSQFQQCQKNWGRISSRALQMNINLMQLNSSNTHNVLPTGKRRRALDYLS